MLEMLKLAAKYSASKSKDDRIFILGAVGIRNDGRLVHSRNEAVLDTHSFNIYKRLGAISDSTPFMKIGQAFHKSFVDQGPAQPGTIVSYYVTAVSNKVESDPSNMVEVLLPVPPPPPGDSTKLDFAKISGSLFDDVSNAPIVHGMVAFIPTMMHPTYDDHNFREPVTTDSNGNFTARVRAGEYFIYSSAHGYYIYNKPTANHLFLWSYITQTHWLYTTREHCGILHIVHRPAVVFLFFF